MPERGVDLDELVGRERLVAAERFAGASLGRGVVQPRDGVAHGAHQFVRVGGLSGQRLRRQRRDEGEKERETAHLAGDGEAERGRLARGRQTREVEAGREVSGVERQPVRCRPHVRRLRAS